MVPAPNARCGAQPPHASTSGRAPAQAHFTPARSGRAWPELQSAPRLLPPCRVTNEGKEMRVAKVMHEAGMDDDEFVVLDPDNPLPRAYQGPLEREVSTTFDEGLLLDEVDAEAMRYWFTEPAGGWLTEKRRMRTAKVLTTDNVDVFAHEDPAGRRPVTQLRPGDLLTGTVVKHLLHHGLQVDVGCDYDGLVAVADLEAWEAMDDAVPDVGAQVEVVVHAVREAPLHRFPLQLMPTDPYLAGRLPAPEDHLPPLDLRDIPLDRYEALAAETGRSWKPQKVVVPLLGEVGTVDYDSKKEREMEEPTEEQLDEFDAIAAGWL